MEYPWIKIENKNNFVFNIKSYHEQDPRWFPYWREEKKRIIEGFWGKDWGKYRFMPAKLYFFVNHSTIIDTDDEEKTRRVIRPLLWDVIWEYAYMSLESMGFSGFSDSDYTCDDRWFMLNKDFRKIDPVKHINLFKADGTLKDYKPARELIRQLYDKPQGRPLYSNETKNYIVLGSRGGSKSYWLACGEILHELITDGIKFYTEENIKNPPKVTIAIGSGDSGKSTETVKKVVEAMTELSQNEKLGVYSRFGNADYCPSPFFKNMLGDFKSNNKENPWRHEFKVRENGEERTQGTGSSLLNVVYSELKGGGKGAQEGAGIRTNISAVDEVGLTKLIIDVYKSNDATIRIGTTYFGRIILFGTSENIEAVQGTKEIFTAPKDYRMLEYDDIYEHSGKTGFFLPAYIIDNKYKDEHGNTNIEEAKAAIMRRRAEKAESANPEILRGEKLNYPILISELWSGVKNKLLPYEETVAREKTLLQNKLYQKIGKPVKLRWDSKFQNGVTYEIDYDSKPIWEYPITNLTDVTGAVVIYDFPQLVDGVIPEDMYIYTLDPYIAEALDEGGSLGVTQVWLNPKYWNEYMITSPLVAAYMGKHKDGKSKYYEEQEKLIAMYGDCPQMFYFEADRGEDCINHYSKKKKLHLLAPRPQSHDSMTQQHIRKFGFVVGGRLDKLNKLSSLHDLLLQEIDDGTKKIRFVETIPDIHLIREIMAYDIEGNFDAVSATLGLVVAIEQLEKFAINDLQGKNIKREKNRLSFLSQNPMIFKPYDDQSYREQHRQNTFWNK
jgi:hypothetical protein